MPIVKVKPIELIYYRDRKPHIFKLHEDVRDSFAEGIAKWIEAGGKFRVTETLRTIAVQAALKKRKPRLACAPGWSMHGHGRAVDFDVSSIGRTDDLKKFYEHMQAFGWYTIFNFPGKPMKHMSREAWHLQNTDPPGMKSREWLASWADKNGGLSALTEIKYQRI